MGRTEEEIVRILTEEGAAFIPVSQTSQNCRRSRTGACPGRHIHNVYKEGELERETTCAKFAHMGPDGDQQYETSLYSLDVIISVGYRVKSQQGTQFRIWANRILKDYLIKGYALSDRVSKENYNELRRLLQLTGRTLHNREEISGDESRSLLDLVVDYAYALDTLDRYDYQQLSIGHTTHSSRFRATYEGAMQAIRSLRDKFGGSTLFGNEKDGSFKSSIGQIYQTFDGKDLYL